MSASPRQETVGRYEIDLVPNEHGGFFARIPDFPTIFTGGETPAEAMQNAFKAIELMIEECRDRGQPVPQPLESFSGQFNVRLPKALHRELVRSAENQGVSLNAMVSYLLAKAVGLDLQKRRAGPTKAKRQDAR